MNSTSSLAQLTHTEIVKQAYASFGRGDIPGLLALLDENVEWNAGGGAQTPTAGRWFGHEGVGRFFRALDQHLVISIFEPRQYIEQGDTVVVLGHYVGKVKSTNREFASNWAMAFSFRGDRVITFTEYTDSAAENRAYGVN